MKLVEAVVEDEKTEVAAMEAFMADFNLLEQAAEAGDFASVAKVADVESLAQYFLISEFTNNPDAFASSFYFYKDGAENKIHAGPAWDFDFALGNLDWWWTDGLVNFHSPEVDQAQRARAWSENGSHISKLLYLLVDIPEFRTEVEQVWQERMSGRGAELVYSIGETANLIREAAIKDGEKWGRRDFDEEVEYLLNWVGARYRFMEKTYGKGWVLPVRVV